MDGKFPHHSHVSCFSKTLASLSKVWKYGVASGMVKPGPPIPDACFILRQYGTPPPFVLAL